MTERSLSELLNDITRFGRKVDSSEKQSWYPSSLGGCDRANILKHAGLSYEIDDRTARVFWLGDTIHHSVQIGLTNVLPDQVWHEVEVRDSVFRVSGRMDTLYRRLDTGAGGTGLDVIELKTIKSLAFAHELPKPDNVLQAAVYLTFPATCPKCCTSHDHRYPVPHTDVRCSPEGCELCSFTGALPIPDRARLFYISKDGKEDPQEYVVTADSVLSDKVKEVVTRLQSQYDEFKSSGKLPPPLPLVPLKIKGVVQKYVKTGAWGKAGATKLTTDWRQSWCDFAGTGLCCAEGATHAVIDNGQIIGTSTEKEEVNG